MAKKRGRPRVNKKRGYASASQGYGILSLALLAGGIGVPSIPLYILSALGFILHTVVQVKGMRLDAEIEAMSLRSTEDISMDLNAIYSNSERLNAKVDTLMQATTQLHQAIAQGLKR